MIILATACTFIIVGLCLIIIGLIMRCNRMRQLLAKCEYENSVLKTKTSPMSEWRFGTPGTIYKQDSTLLPVLKRLVSKGLVDVHCVKNGKLSQCVLNLDAEKLTAFEQEQHKEHKKFMQQQQFHHPAQSQSQSQPQAQPQAQAQAPMPTYINMGANQEGLGKKEALGGTSSSKKARSATAATAAAARMHSTNLGKPVHSISNPLNRRLDSAGDEEFKWTKEDSTDK